MSEQQTATTQKAITPLLGGNPPPSQDVSQWHIGVPMFLFAWVAGTILLAAALWGLPLGVAPALAGVGQHLVVAVKNPSGYWQWAESVGLSLYITWHLAIPAALALLPAAWAGWTIGQPLQQFRIVRGYDVLKGRAGLRALKKVCRGELKSDAPALTLHPELPAIAHRRATRGFMIFGAIGSGKTTVMWPIIEQAVSAGAYSVIYDNKGDFTEAMPGGLGTDWLLLAPWDARSGQWGIDRDLLNLQHAKTWSRLIIKDSHDPMWANAARAILVGACAILIKRRAATGRRWGWKDLLELSDQIADSEELRQAVYAEMPEAKRIIENLESKTGQSIQINLAAYLGPIADLAHAWPRPKPDDFSIRAWVQRKTSYRTVILQGSEEYAEVRESLHGGILALFAAMAASPIVPNVKPVGGRLDPSRRTYVFIDEFVQLGKVPGLIKLIEVGRSKGLVPVYGFQDPARVEEVYGRQTLDVLQSSIGTKTVCRLSLSEGAETVSRQFGEREIERRQTTVQSDGSQSQTWQRMSERVVTAQEIDGLALKKNGVQAYASGFGNQLYLLTFPFADMPKRREPSEPAAWTLGADIEEIYDTPAPASPAAAPAAPATPAAPADADAGDASLTARVSPGAGGASPSPSAACKRKAAAVSEQLTDDEQQQLLQQAMEDAQEAGGADDLDQDFANEALEELAQHSMPGGHIIGVIDKASELMQAMNPTGDGRAPVSGAGVRRKRRRQLARDDNEMEI